MINRRTLIGTGMAGLSAAALFPHISFATAPTDKRFIFILQRGAADGLHCLIPHGDPGFTKLRGDMASIGGEAKKLDGLFGLHPALQNIGQLYDQKQVVFFHAVASIYRERSHFDGQAVLESGVAAGSSGSQGGWMARLIKHLNIPSTRAFALARSAPLILRDDDAVATYSSALLNQQSPLLLAQMSKLYASNSGLSSLWQNASVTRDFVKTIAVQDSDDRLSPEMNGAIAAKLMVPAGGARVVLIETDGWDTHSNQMARLDQQLYDLDQLIASLQRGLGSFWDQTMVMIVTEFGRSATANGTDGTDHGTASCAMLLGGGLNGGQIITDWPGLQTQDLFEARDLRPTIAIESMISSALAAHFNEDPSIMAQALYPAQKGLKTLNI